jgi:membrane protein YqaA with SNARE-associated domain
MSFELFMQFYQQIQDVLANNTFQDYGILGLFLNSFLSATAIPLPTEILTSALLLGGESQILVGIALVLGSTIGGVLNYFIGFGGNTLLTKFKKKKDQKKVEQKNKDNKLLEKFGWGAVFFASWIPVEFSIIPVLSFIIPTVALMILAIYFIVKKYWEKMISTAKIQFDI